MAIVKGVDGFDMEGIFSVSLDYGNGKEVFYKEENIITLPAKRYILRSLYIASMVSDPIIELRVGTGGCVDPLGKYPKVPDPEQTALSTPLLIIPCSNLPDIPNVVVKFLADVDNSQGNGSLLSEAGLFKVSGGMFNLKNHPGIPKTSEFSVHYEWDIKIL